MKLVQPENFGEFIVNNVLPLEATTSNKKRIDPGWYLVMGIMVLSFAYGVALLGTLLTSVWGFLSGDEALMSSAFNNFAGLALGLLAFYAPFSVVAFIKFRLKR